MKDMDTVGALPGLGSMENCTPACRSSQKEPCTYLCDIDVLPRTSYSAAVALLCELKSNIIRRSGTHSEVRMDTPCPAAELNWSCPGFITMSAE